MLQLFRNNQFYTIIFVILYALLLSANSWFQPEPDWTIQTDKTGLILKNFLSYVSEKWAYVLFFLIILVQSIMINGLIFEFRIAKRNTYITSVIYILCIFLFPGTDILSPALLVNFLIIMALTNIYQAYDKKNSVIEVFNAGFYISLATLIYFPTLWFFLFIGIAWFSLRSFNIKEFLILLSALLIPYFLMGTYQFVFGDFQNWWRIDIIEKWTMVKFSISTEVPFLIALTLFGLLLIWNIIRIQQLKSKTTIREQKFINVLYWLLLISVLSVAGQSGFFAKQDTAHFVMIALPLGILFSLNLQSIQNNKIAERLHFFILLTVLVIQYYSYILGFISPFLGIS